jgi:hypothetical protein
MRRRTSFRYRVILLHDARCVRVYGVVFREREDAEREAVVLNAGLGLARGKGQWVVTEEARRSTLPQMSDKAPSFSRKREGKHWGIGV